MHPGGTMAEMLADPRWLPGHLLVFGGLVAMLVGLRAYGRTPAAESMRRVLRFAKMATAVQAIEMFLHAMAFVDLQRLQAGRVTPVLTTHLSLAVIAYPLFAAAVIALIVAGARRRVLGSPWIAWIGILGVAAHGAAAPLTVVFDVSWAPLLFPGLAVLAVWLVLAAAWPSENANNQLPTPKAQLPRS